jgi:hypothetical protein
MEISTSRRTINPPGLPKAFYTGQEPDNATLPTSGYEYGHPVSFSDKLENMTIFGPWAGNGKANIVSDPGTKEEM